MAESTARCLVLCSPKATLSGSPPTLRRITHRPSKHRRGERLWDHHYSSSPLHRRKHRGSSISVVGRPLYRCMQQNVLFVLQCEQYTVCTGRCSNIFLHPDVCRRCRQYCTVCTAHCCRDFFVSSMCVDNSTDVPSVLHVVHIYIYFCWCAQAVLHCLYCSSFSFVVAVFMCPDSTTVLSVTARFPNHFLILIRPDSTVLCVLHVVPFFFKYPDLPGQYCTALSVLHVVLFFSCILMYADSTDTADCLYCILFKWILFTIDCRWLQLSCGTVNQGIVPKRGPAPRVLRFMIRYILWRWERRIQTDTDTDTNRQTDRQTRSRETER